MSSKITPKLSFDTTTTKQSNISPDADAKPSLMDLDYVLINQIGQFGKYQFLMMLTLALPILWTAFGSEYIFSAASIKHRCFIPECDSYDNPQMNTSWLLDAIPLKSSTSLDDCHRYMNITLTNQTLDTCPELLFDKNQTVTCESYVYENINSIVYDFGLECNEWKRVLVGTIHGLGTLIALPIVGFVSDKYGRKVALIFSLFNYGLFGFLRAFSINYEMFIVLVLLQLSLGSGTYSSAFLLATEFVGPKYRVAIGATISTLFSCGEAAMGLIAWIVPRWRTLYLVLFTPMMFGVGFYFIIFESARWLISKKKYDQAKEVLDKVCKINKQQISKSTYDALFAEKNLVKETPLIKEITRSRIMLKRICTTPFWWITNVLIYYGLSINSISLYGNMYVNFIIVSLIEIPGFWTSLILLDSLGRKITLFIAYLTCSACTISFAFVPEGNEMVSLVLYLVSKFSIALVFTSTYIYTAELYPTTHRHSLLGFSSMVGRIGSMVAPLTPALTVYWSGLPSAIFGVMAFTAALLVLTTPETLGTKLPETMEEAENIGRKK